MILYQENQPRKGNDGRPIFRGRAVPYDEQLANDHWARHYANQLVLTSILRNASQPISVRRQAEVELRMCEKKLAHWTRHKNWDAAVAARDALAARQSVASLGRGASASGRSAVG